MTCSFPSGLSSLAVPCAHCSSPTGLLSGAPALQACSYLRAFTSDYSSCLDFPFPDLCMADSLISFRFLHIVTTIVPFHSLPMWQLSSLSLFIWFFFFFIAPDIIC